MAGIVHEGAAPPYCHDGKPCMEAFFLFINVQYRFERLDASATQISFQHELLETSVKYNPTFNEMEN